MCLKQANAVRFLLRKPSRSPPAGGGHGFPSLSGGKSELESERYPAYKMKFRVASKTSICEILRQLK